MTSIISRKAFVGATLLGISAMLRGPSTAFGLTNRQQVPFSPEVAVNVAKSFISSKRTIPQLDIGEPIPTYDLEGHFKGYSIGFFNGSHPHGHIVLDSDCNGLMLELSTSEGDMEPYSRITSSCRSISSATPPRLITFGPNCYGIPTSKSTIETQFETFAAPEATIRNLSSPGTDFWSNVLISYDDAYGDNYFIGDEKYAGDLNFITQQEAEKAARMYACGPHALLALACTLPNDEKTNTAVSYPPTDPVIKESYQRLWSYTNTVVTSTSNGISYGHTRLADLPGGFVRYCRERKTTVTATSSLNTSFLAFVNRVNQRDLSIIGGGINTPNGESGHFMTVNGYSYLNRKNDNKVLQVLSVFDGWDNMQFLNYDFPRFTWRGSVLITRNK